MRRRRNRLGVLAMVLATAAFGVAAAPVDAAAPSFGAKLATDSQPSNAEGGIRCDDNNNIPAGSKCTWLSTQAYRNGPTGDRSRAPKSGTIVKLKLVSCVAGTFTLQIARLKPGSNTKARVVRNGPVIHYDADPFVSDGDPETFCGGDDGIFTVQTFNFSGVHVDTGDMIAIKTKKGGTFYCSGGSGINLYAPPLVAGASNYVPRRTSTSCNLLVQLYYSS